MFALGRFIVDNIGRRANIFVFDYCNKVFSVIYHIYDAVFIAIICFFGALRTSDFRFDSSSFRSSCQAR